MLGLALEIFIRFLFAYYVASWNAVRGSGLLKFEDSVLWLIKIPIKHFTAPLFISTGLYLASGSWVLALAGATPYYLKMFTGTGGDMQAGQNNKNVGEKYMEEWILFDKLAMKLAGLKIYNLPLAQRWGLWYCTLWGILFSLPFLMTNYLYAIPVLFYPMFVRYLSWRKVEFFYMLVYVFMLNLSIGFESNVILDALAS
tara:strand:- start:817 stop:1413 length:597 start_codon:yes stop_codon:yes gene_type:complete